MSAAFAAEPARSDRMDEDATRPFHPSAMTVDMAQNHDRIGMGSQRTGYQSAPAPGPAPTLDSDITLGQRMISAIYGSFLTSVLVTPLDVVRVRLQSQAAKLSAGTLPSISTPSLQASSPARFTSVPNLGVTTCCREVFFHSNSASHCLVETAIPTVLSPPSHSTTLSTAACAVDETRKKAFDSTYDGLKKIARNEGVRALWRGLSPTLAMSIPGNIIYFAGYDGLRSSDKSPIKKYVPQQYSALVAGSTARVAAAVVVSPIEMLRTRMQATAGGANALVNTFSGLRDMVAAQGITSLWRGLTLTMWRDVPFSGIYWWSYETVRHQLLEFRKFSGSKATSRSDQNNSSTLIDSFIAGAVSGALASILTSPFDVGKTRQQVYSHSKDRLGPQASHSSSSSYASYEPIPEERSMPRFLAHIYRTEGFAGLMRGWAARTLKVAPACAIMISSYEIGKKWAKGVNENSNTRKTM